MYWCRGGLGTSLQQEPHPIVMSVKMTVVLVSLCLLVLSRVASSTYEHHYVLYIACVGQPEIILSYDTNSSVAGESFTFNCTTNSTAGLTLYIDGATDSPKTSRINRTDIGDKAAEYTFRDTVPDDNGTLFECYVENFNSNGLLLTVYCKLYNNCSWH